MAQMSSEEIARAARDLNLVSDQQLQEVWGTFGSQTVPAEYFAQALLGRDMLTSYQLQRIKRGEKSGYFYGNYKVLYFVGSGSFARVYRAEQQATGQTFALKVLRHRYCGDSEEAIQVRDQFRRESDMGLTLRHPNIVPVFDVGTDNDVHYMVMEFVEGSSLRDFLEVRRVCEPHEALRLIMDVVAGLDYAYQRGIAHRDIKLSNILVSSRGTAKLVDFGLAAPGGEVTDVALSNCPNPRTIDYAALERATGVRRDDRRSDIFFVGCMLYHVLTGTAPLADTKDRMKRLSKTRFQQITPIRQVGPELPAAVVAVVNKAMQLEVKRRYQSPREMLVDLQKAIRRLNEARQDQAHDDDTVVEDDDARSQVMARSQRAVMFVESNPQLQDVFRQRLKATGFRVLMTSDPLRALSRFRDEEVPPAQCVVFSTHDLGEAALEAFERFIQDSATRAIPAVLMLGEAHSDWSNRSDGAPHHIVVQMPIRLGKFRAVLDQLVSHPGS